MGPRGGPAPCRGGSRGTPGAVGRIEGPAGVGGSERRGLAARASPGSQHRTARVLSEDARGRASRAGAGPGMDRGSSANSRTHGCTERIRQSLRPPTIHGWSRCPRPRDSVKGFRRPCPAGERLTSRCSLEATGRTHRRSRCSLMPSLSSPCTPASSPSSSAALCDPCTALRPNARSGFPPGGELIASEHQQSAFRLRSHRKSPSTSPPSS